MEFEIKSFSLTSAAIPIRKTMKSGKRKITDAKIAIDITMALMPIIKPNTFVYTDRGVIYRFEFGDFQVYQISAIEGREIWSFRSVKYVRSESSFGIEFGSTIEGSQIYVPISEANLSTTYSLSNANYKLQMKTK